LDVKHARIKRFISITSEVRTTPICAQEFWLANIDGISCPWFHDNALAAVVQAEQAQVRDRWLDTVNEILAYNTAEDSRAKAITDLRYLCPQCLQNEYPSLKPLGDAIKAILDSAQEGDHDSDAAKQHTPDRSKGSN
jgi:hypothetical protein